MTLSARHKAFINEYVACYFNATEAYSRVYPKASRETARRNGHELLTNTDIDAEIKRRVAEQAMGPNEVLLRLGEQARNAHGNYITAEGFVDLPRLIADGKGHLIKGIKETQYGKNIEFHDAQTALSLLGKHHNLFKEQTEHTGEYIVRVKYDDKGTDSPSTDAPSKTA